MAAASYAGLAISAAGMALARGGQPDNEQATQDRTAWLMSQPLGGWPVALVGLIVVGVGIAQFVRAYRGSFLDKLDRQQMGDTLHRVLEVAVRRTLPTDGPQLNSVLTERGRRAAERR